MFSAIASHDSTERMARRPTTVLVSGTNGKTTTTALLVHAAGIERAVASNRSGANLMSGVVGALLDAPEASVAILEVDEIVLPAAIELCQPKVVALLNLTRDQMDRVHEVRRISDLWRDSLQGQDLVVVANADDPLVVHAVRDCDDVVWVGAGQPWQADASACPRCTALIDFATGGWRCTSCSLQRPATTQTRDTPPVLLPGRCNQANAAMAMAVLGELGWKVDEDAWMALRSVAGRYEEIAIDGRHVRLLLAKNPAGWLETLTLLDPARNLVIALNAREEDGRDPSWIWDVPFETLRNPLIVCIGERAADLAVRIDHAGLTATIEPNVRAAVRRHPPGAIDLVANYSAFRDARARLIADG